MLEMITAKAQDKLWKNFSRCLAAEAAEEFLETLLTLMKIMFVVNPEYRENIRDFDGRYQFCGRDGLKVAAVFRRGRMEVTDDVLIADPHITITFRDGRTLMKFLLAPKQDILGSMLRHDVVTEGNLNYLYRFGYMAKRLQLMMPAA